MIAPLYHNRHKQSDQTSKRLYYVVAGEARTEAMVRAMEGGNDESFAFDSFADPAGLIMTTVIEQHCRKAPNYNLLLDRAKSLKLPTNPLVCLPYLFSYSYSVLYLLYGIFTCYLQSVRYSSLNA